METYWEKMRDPLMRWSIQNRGLRLELMEIKKEDQSIVKW